MGEMTKPDILEQNAVWVLRAVKNEWMQRPSFTACRPEIEVVAPLKKKFNLTDDDLDLARIFLVTNRLVEIAGEGAVRRMRPTEMGTVTSHWPKLESFLRPRGWVVKFL
jgi:hypothetical protein